jgi:hypothetical protein
MEFSISIGVLIWRTSFSAQVMNPERQQFLNLRSKPGRLTAEEAGWFLGFVVHEIPMLMSAGFLKPLGRPSENGCKFFSLIVLDKLNQDPEWQARASDAIVKYWKDRNLQRPTKKGKPRWPQKLPPGNPKKIGRGIKPLSPRKPPPAPQP